MNSCAMENQDLKQYFKEIKPLEKDLSDIIFQKIALQKSRYFQPVSMPPVMLWGIVSLFMVLLAYAFYKEEGAAGSILDMIQFPNFPSLPHYQVDPFVIVIMPILAISIWLIIFLEKKIMSTIP